MTNIYIYIYAYIYIRLKGTSGRSIIREVIASHLGMTVFSYLKSCRKDFTKSSVGVAQIKYTYKNSRILSTGTSRKGMLGDLLQGSQYTLLKVFPRVILRIPVSFKM